MRGFVAVYVVAGHALAGSLGAVDPILHFGQEAVMVFFVMSGFVIRWTTSSLASLSDFRSYFFKRFARIYSVWVPGVALFILLASVEAGRLSLDPPGRFLGNILMLQDVPNIKPAVICDPLYGAAPLWTLGYEWWLYMMFPLALLLIRGPMQHHVVGMLAVINSWVYVFYPNHLSRVFIYLAIWWIGVRAAVALRERGKIRFADISSSTLYVLAAAVPLCLRAAWMWHDRMPMMLGRYPLLELRHVLGTVALVAAGFLWRKCGWAGFRWTVGLFAIFAPIAYALYFIHYNSLAKAGYFAFIGNKSAEMFLYVLVTIGFCCLIEILFYPWFRRLLESAGWIKTRKNQKATTPPCSVQGQLKSAN